jgi:hypothetical protein
MAALGPIPLTDMDIMGLLLLIWRFKNDFILSKCFADLFARYSAKFKLQKDFDWNSDFLVCRLLWSSDKQLQTLREILD